MPCKRIKFDLKWKNKLILTIIIFFFYPLNFISQTIVVDDISNTKEQLVDFLIGNSCISKSNVAISSNKSVAYFNNNSGAFPISEGIIIRNGIAEYTSGLYNNENLSSQISSNGDADLQEISNDTGQSSTITDVAFLEFDFIPLANTLDFNFLFASNEYGEYQCSFSDVFAIILTNLNTGESVNMAVLPGTNTNISIKNIRDNLYNSSCSSINSNLFGTYNVDNPSNSSLNMRGHTKVMNASANVIIDNPYRIKFAIGDYNDGTFDSAVFVESGSFDATFSLGEDLEICDGNEITLDSKYTNLTDYNYVWQKDGNTLIGENNPTLKVLASGTYSLVITNLLNNCVIQDEIIVTNLQVNQPNNIIECASDNSASFNLTLNNHAILGIDENEYDIVYYNSLDNVNNNISIALTEIENYVSAGGETIYIKLRNKTSNSFCNVVLTFDLIILKLEITTPDDILVCKPETETNFNIPSEVESQLLTGLINVDYTVNYFTSEQDANNNTNIIPNPTNFPLPISNTNPINIWVKVINNTNNDCFAITNFSINSSQLPLVDELPDAYDCSEYILPTLTNGNYFTDSQGTGTQLFPGDIITTQTQIFIYNINSDRCSDETSFIIFITEEYNLALEYCGQFVIPTYPNAFFYTASLGPNGSGTIIPAGTVLTENQTIYFYAEKEDGSFCTEKEFAIIINEIPTVDSFNNVITCNSYALPQITNGQFYTGTNGTGTQLNTGDLITTSKKIYAFNRNPITTCINQSSFDVTIINTNALVDITACGSYTIPNTTIGNYFTQASGVNLLPAGTVLTSSQTIYFYAAEVTTTPNCTENIPIDIIIKALPLVDNLNDILRCEDNLPTLPALNNGNYFTQTNGTGNQLFEGAIINTSQKIYIYNKNTFCDAETSFLVEIKSKPLVDNLTFVNRCNPYTLPTLINGNYFTESGGQGTQLNPGDVISTSQILYIFNKDNEIETCTNENVLDIVILTIEVDKIQNQIACELFELQPLNVGNYFTAPNGQGTQLSAGDIINTTQTIYVYAEIGGRLLCTDQSEFIITIINKPVLANFQNLESCGSITLPTLTIPNVVIEYYNNPNGTSLIDPSEYTISDLGTRNIYVVAYPEGNPDCFTQDEFEIIVYPLLDLKIEGGVICVDDDTGLTTKPLLLASNLDQRLFTVNWYLNGNLVGTGTNYNAVEAGTYTVETIKLTQDVGPNCNYNIIEVVVESSNPKFEVVFLTENFVDTYSIVVNTVSQGLGNYVYSLDNGPFQTSNRFYNISPGEYVVTVRDLSGFCNDIKLNFLALKYPKFFTPNNDGRNDTWNITDLKNDKNAIIKVYTRIGRLITVIKPNGIGWNGYNSNGNIEATRDYWFEVMYTKKGELAIYRNHFSLLRK